MTEQEVIERIYSKLMDGTPKDKDACDIAIDAFEKSYHYRVMERRLKAVYGDCGNLLETVVEGFCRHSGVDIGTPVKSRLLTDEDVDKWDAYRAIGTVEECKKAVKEEDALKFYYCESEDDYYIGKRVGNFYYARYGETGFEWFMSRYLPWGEHVVEPNTLWKEYTYPSEPKEIPFFEWLQGFLKKYCGGTVEECREAREKQTPKAPKDSLKIEPIIDESGAYVDADTTVYILCPNCGELVGMDEDIDRFCRECGQAILREGEDD